MYKIKKGDIVGRKSYGKDIIFTVTNIFENKNAKIAILKGIFERIEVDSDIQDLELIDKNLIKKKIKELDEEIDGLSKKKTNKKRSQQKYITGKILHLDGDKKYSQKSFVYYRNLGLNAIVKNIPEYNQPKEVYKLLKFYNPDILIVTGHDGMLKKERDFNNIYNYRNSKYFIETVKEARRYEKKENKSIVIFAGACQSYFEAIMSAGANFASSPARILIDFLDPLIIAKKVAKTENYKYVTIDDIYYELRDGKKGIDGIGAQGKMKKILL